nr:MAG TPA: hypothetical protein [Caudoviricetes sp.]
MRIYIAACNDDHLESFLTALSAGDGEGEVCLDFSRNPGGLFI